MRTALAQARADNETVYFEPVPSRDALPPCVGKCLVKPLLPPELDGPQ